MWSPLTAQRFARLLLLGALADIIWTQPGRVTLINLLILFIISTVNAVLPSITTQRPFKLSWWQQACYWTVLCTFLLVLLTLIHVSLFTLGDLVPDHPYRINLMAISALMIGIMAGGLLKLSLSTTAKP